MCEYGVVSKLSQSTQLAKQMEGILYESAANLQSYEELSTLNQRLQMSAFALSERQQELRNQQHRLLLLHHAYVCPDKTGKCPRSRHCAEMKLLWKHINECEDEKCKVSHCLSSRCVLLHHKSCKDEHCPICKPVRKAIARWREKVSVVRNCQLRRRQPNFYNHRVASSERDNPNGYAIIILLVALSERDNPNGYAIIILFVASSEKVKSEKKTEKARANSWLQYCLVS